MSYLPIGKDTGDHDVVGNPDMELREQDRWLPIANVARLMKNTLPATAKVSKDAKECMQECVSEFISFITSEASDKCVREKRKTINGEDILYLMHDLGFENYAEVLKIYLAKYREQQALKQERGECRSLKKLAKKRAVDAKPPPQTLDDHPYIKDDLVDANLRHPDLQNPADAPGPDTEQSLDSLGYLATPSVKDVRSPDYFQSYDGTGAGAGELASGEMHMGDVHVALDGKEAYLQGKDGYLQGKDGYLEGKDGYLEGKETYSYNDYIHEDKDKSVDLGKLGDDADMDNLAAGIANNAGTYY